MTIFILNIQGEEIRYNDTLMSFLRLEFPGYSDALNPTKKDMVVLCLYKATATLKGKFNVQIYFLQWELEQEIVASLNTTKTNGITSQEIITRMDQLKQRTLKS